MFQEKAALEKAKKAVQKEKILQNHREIGQFVGEGSHPDITHFVMFNLGTMLEANGLDDEANNAYRTVPNKKVLMAPYLCAGCGQEGHIPPSITD